MKKVMVEVMMPEGLYCAEDFNPFKNKCSWSNGDYCELFKDFTDGWKKLPACPANKKGEVNG